MQARRIAGTLTGQRQQRQNAALVVCCCTIDKKRDKRAQKDGCQAGLDDDGDVGLDKARSARRYDALRQVGLVAAQQELHVRPRSQRDVVELVVLAYANVVGRIVVLAEHVHLPGAFFVINAHFDIGQAFHNAFVPACIVLIGLLITVHITVIADARVAELLEHSHVAEERRQRLGVVVQVRQHRKAWQLMKLKGTGPAGHVLPEDTRQVRLKIDHSAHTLQSVANARHFRLHERAKRSESVCRSEPSTHLARLAP